MKIVDGVRYYGRSYALRKEDENNCINEIWETGGWGQYQCSRKRGHGPDGLYCKQHDPDRIKIKQEAEDKEYERRRKVKEDANTRRLLEREFCEPFTDNELSAGIRERKEL